MNIPQIGTKWLHENGVEYTVFDLLNLNADAAHAEKYPVIVCYHDSKGNKWGKTVPEFLRRRTPVEPKTSTWETRKALFTPKTSVFFPEQPSVLQIVVPEIQLWDPNSNAVGAFAYVHHSTAFDTAQERYTICSNLVSKIWEETRANQGSANQFSVDLDAIQLAPASRAVIDYYLDKNVTFIGTSPKEAFVTAWKTSYGGSLRDLTVFVSILIQMRAVVLGRGFIAEQQILRYAKDVFNQLVNEQVTSGIITNKNAPAAVFDNDKLRILLPEDILGRNDSEIRYAEVSVIRDTLNIFFPHAVSELLLAIYSKDLV
jgi:hypothetical protein